MSQFTHLETRSYRTEFSYTGMRLVENTEKMVESYLPADKGSFWFWHLRYLRKEVCSLMPCRRAVVLTIGVNKHHLRSDYELKKCVVSDPEATFTTWSEEYGSLIWQI
ncbi:uncharacterized protein LOC126585503 isoform X1 [Malus sylvestris]|uniref:uncharacterized protein LOC126585503 isoform X1 n=1 Tax=Malus sylvestris TaxID=3752 RepID=UPI0021ACD6FE|nr:uncharacterized protein LOC126585503 isoform X1 [Malus sylvestris]